MILSSKVFNFHVNNDTPQILGAGVQYFFGTNKDILKNSFIIQRTDIKGLEDFHLSSINIELKKWAQLKSFYFRYGPGSIFLKTLIFSNSENTKRKRKDQLNFFEFDFLYKTYFFGPWFRCKTEQKSKFIINKLF